MNLLFMAYLSGAALLLPVVIVGLLAIRPLINVVKGFTGIGNARTFNPGDWKARPGETYETLFARVNKRSK